VIDADDELVINAGQTAVMNGTLRVTGSVSFRPQLTIVNNGQFTIQDGMFRAENASIVIQNAGGATISANNLAITAENASIVVRNAVGATISANNLAMTTEIADSEVRLLNQGSIAITGGLTTESTGGTVSVESDGSMEINDWASNTSSSGKIRLCSLGDQLTINDANLQAIDSQSSQALSINGNFTIGNLAITVAQASLGVCLGAGVGYIGNLNSTCSGYGTLAFKILQDEDLTINNGNFQAYGAYIHLLNDGAFFTNNMYLKSQMDSQAWILFVNKNNMSLNNWTIVGNGAEGQAGLINESRFTANNVQIDLNYGGSSFICNASGSMEIGNLWVDISGASHGQPSRFMLHNNDSFLITDHSQIIITNTIGPVTILDDYPIDKGVFYTFQVNAGVIVGQDTDYCDTQTLTDACALNRQFWELSCMREAEAVTPIPAVSPKGLILMIMVLLGMGVWMLSRRTHHLH